MLGTFIQINTKEFYRGIFETMWWFLWTFKWIWLPLIIIPLIVKLLIKIFGRKMAGIILFLILVLTIAAFFIWLYK
jgi:hypothetical protein